MSTPNEFVPSASQTFHHESVASLIIQAAHSNSNFPPPVPNSDGGTAQFNGGSFFHNPLGSYDISVLPLFHHSSQRTSHFNNAPFSHQKPVQTENTRLEQSQIPTADGRSNVFHTEATTCPSPIQSAYWSRQSQLSPFGVLPHEISPDLMDEPKSHYENQLNPHFTSQSLNNLNQIVESDKKAQVIVVGKSKEANLKRQTQYISKHQTDLKMNSSGCHHDEMDFRNGVINHGNQAIKVDQNKIMNSNYKNTKSELISSLQIADPINTVPRDYRVFKSPSLFSNSSSPTVKYIEKSSEKQYMQKQITDSKNPLPNVPVISTPRLSANSSLMIHQKMTDFHEDSQSSPISLTSEEINGHHKYTSPSEVPHNNIKELESETSFHNLNLMNSSVPHTITPSVSVSSGYHEQQLQDINCHNADKNKVTSQFLKLPYAVSNIQNNIPSEPSHLHRKTPPFGPLYIMYNNPVNVSGHPTTIQKYQEKFVGNERLESQNQPQTQTNNVKLSNITRPAENGSPIMNLPKPVQNGLVGYPSVIMRTDRNFDNEEKTEKTQRRSVWSDTERQTSSVQQSVKNDKLMHYNRNEDNPQLQTSLSEHHHILLGVSERQHSYFDTTLCTSPIVPQDMNKVKCNSKNATKNVYEEQRVQEQQHRHTISHSQRPEQIPRYQYLPVNNKAQVLASHSSVDTSSEVADKLYPRKRKTSKNGGNNLHLVNDSRGGVTTAEYPNRDPPPAHVNLYSSQIENTNYIMDGLRYEGSSHTMTKLYPPSNEQFYSQSNVNYNVNPVTNVPHENHLHHTVISSHSTVPAGANPSVNSQVSQVSSISPSLPLSAYFSSFHPSSHYAQHEFSVNVSNCNISTTQSFSIPNEVLPASSYTENSLNSDKNVYGSRIKVIVPNIEEEFKFLFDPKLPNFKQISSCEEEELYKTPAGRQTFYRKNIDFLASYIKFLENNCESVETLTDSNSNAMKNWNRTKVVYQPVIKDKEENTVAGPGVLPVPKEPAKLVIKETECNFENDPRYYPLPKSSDKRRLCDSSSDEELELQAKKSKLVANNKKLVSLDVEKKKARIVKKKEKKESKSVKSKKKKSDSKKEINTEIVTNVSGKMKKSAKTKLKIEKLQKKKNHFVEKEVKPKIEKATEMKTIKQSYSVGTQKKKLANDIEVQKSVSRRKVSERKAKDEVKSKIRSALDSEDEFVTSSDSDPSWTPRDDVKLQDDENISKHRSTRARSVRVKTKASKKAKERYLEDNLHNNRKYEKNTAADSFRTSKNNSKKSIVKVGQFYILKGDSNVKHLVLWCFKNGKLQKFEPLNRNGKNLFSGVSEVLEISEVDLSQYQEVKVSVVEHDKDRVIVELSGETDIPTDIKIKEDFMKESLCYEHQFAVYIQTLVSQALDSNFLSEIVKENDVYFLNNMKVIDDVTATYLSDLTSVIKWGGSSVDLLVKTWPFLSIKNIRNESIKTSNSLCSSCKETNARQTAIFYGQPYLRETLQGCQSNLNIPNNLEKAVDLCSGCSRKIKLFNKIWHQKYHVFVECAKYVSKKKSENKNKGTTDILNELLADATWLSKLFYDIRNTWLQVWTIVRKIKGS